MTLTQALARENYVGDISLTGFAGGAQRFYRFVWTTRRPSTSVATAWRSRTCFKKEPASLTHRETVSLAAMMIAPNRFDPEGRAERNAERSRRIERLLRGECRPNGVLDTALKGCAR